MLIHLKTYIKWVGFTLCSFCPQSSPASGTFPMSQLFTSNDQNTGVSASASVLSKSIQGWFPLVWSPCCLRDSQESSPAPQFEVINPLGFSLFTVQLSQSHVTTGKTIALTLWTSVSTMMSLLFNTLSRFVIACLRFSFKQALSLSSFTLIKRLFSSSFLSAIKVASNTYLKLLMFLLHILIPACNSSSPARHMMCASYILNKQGDRRQSCSIPFSILNQLAVPYRGLTVVSWPTYRLLMRQVIWSSIPISLRVFHSLLWST